MLDTHRPTRSAIRIVGAPFDATFAVGFPGAAPPALFHSVFCKNFPYRSETVPELNSRVTGTRTNSFIHRAEIRNRVSINFFLPSLIRPPAITRRLYAFFPHRQRAEPKMRPDDITRSSIFFFFFLSQFLANREQ